MHAKRPWGRARPLGLKISRILVGWVALLSWAKPVSAAETRSRVLFVLEEPTALVGALQSFDSLTGQLGELSVDMRVVHAPQGPSLEQSAKLAMESAEATAAAAALWFTEELGGTITIHALHVPSGQVYIRRVELTGGVALAREEISVAIRAIIPALLEGGQRLGASVLVVPRASSTRPSEPTVAETPDSAGARATELLQVEHRFTLGYAATRLSSQAPWQSALAAGLLLDWGNWFRTSAGASYAFEVGVRGDGANALISRIPFHLRAGTFLDAPYFRWGIEVGPLLEIWRRRTELVDSTLVATPSTSTVRAGASLSTRVEVDVVGDFGVYLLGAVQWLPFPHTVTIAGVESTRDVSMPGFLPSIELGIFLDPFPQEKSN